MERAEDPLLIYLADLTHEGAGRLAVDMMPYNIGLIAAYAQKALGGRVQIKPFKYAQTLLKALEEQPPHLLGCSNYCWNNQLSQWACRRAKQQDPSILTVFGGTNYPFDAASQERFLKQQTAVDLHIFYEGERTFVNLLEAFMETPDPARLRERAIAGCQSISPTSGRLVSGSAVERIRNLDEIPSPYTAGLMDPFFDGRLSPVLETNRGCPFTCNFCNAGASYFSRVSTFSLTRLTEEMEYIAPRMAKLGIGTLMLSDNNFGMYPRDEQLCRELKRLHDQHEWPTRILSTTGKNSQERIIRATEILGATMGINMSVQSMDPNVLGNIKRQNIKLEAYRKINETLLKQGRTQKAEVIVPLPGETYASYLSGLRALMTSGAQLIYSYTLQLLHGTDYKDPEYRKYWRYRGKWRVVPFNFGEYAGEKLFDLEEVAVQSSTFSYEEYLKIRVIALLTEIMYNDYQYIEILKYLREYNLSPLDWILETLESLDQAPSAIQKVIRGFTDDTQNELWDSEEELFRHYRQQENYEKLVSGEAGHNVVFTHKGTVMSRHTQAWIPFITQSCLQLILRRRPETADPAQVRAETSTLSDFLLKKLQGVLQEKGCTQDIVCPMRYDLLGWLGDTSGKRLGTFKVRKPLAYRFYFSEAQLEERQEYLRRYGFDRTGLARIFARNPSLQTLYRSVEPVRQAGAVPVAT